MSLGAEKERGGKQTRKPRPGSACGISLSHVSFLETVFQDQSCLQPPRGSGDVSGDLPSGEVLVSLEACARIQGQ